MRSRAALAWAAVVIASSLAPASAAPPAKPAPKPPASARGPRPPPAPPPRPAASPLPMLPSVGRVQVRLSRNQVVVVEEVLLPRGDWKTGPIELWVAFGAPSVPRAIDAHLVPLGDGVLAPEDDDAGETVPTERAPRRPPSANPLLGRDAMAGVVVRLDAGVLGRAFAAGGMAALRLRSVLDAPEEDPSGGRGILVRLGASRGTPLTLGRVALTSGPEAPKVTRVEAKLCGPDADDHPLAVGTTPKLPTEGAPRLAPVLAVRHASDDLCVRWWN